MDHVRLWLLHGTSGTTLDLWSVVGASNGVMVAVGEALGLAEGAIKVAAHRLRRKYQRLREQIGHTVATDDTIDEEIQYLFRALKT